MLDGEDTAQKIMRDAPKEPGAKVQSAESPKRLRDRAPKRALPFAARTSAVMRVAVQNGKDEYSEKTVHLPPVLEAEPVALALINGLQVMRDKETTTAYFRWCALEKFLPFATSHIVAERLPKDIFDLYRAWLNKRYAQRSVASYVSAVRKPLEAGAANADFMLTLDEDEQEHIRSIIACIPCIPTGVGKKRPGMGELFEGLPEDRALFDGLRDFATWALAELQSHREELLHDADVSAALAEAMAMVGDDLEALAYKSKRSVPHDHWNPSTLCNAIYEAVCRSQSQTLKERLLIGIPKYREGLFDKWSINAAVSIDELNEHLAKFRLQHKTGTRSNENILSVASPSVSFDQCDLLSLVKPTYGEHICVQWLLAGVAVQTSGQQRAQVGDYVIQANSSYLDYTKNRAKIKFKYTDSISKKSATGMALNSFIVFKETQSGDQSRLLDYNHLASIPTSSSPRWRFLLAATHTPSAIRKAFLESHPMGEKFLILLTALRIHGDAYSTFNSQRTNLKKRLRNGRLTPAEHEEALKTLIHESTITTKTTISPDSIRNTRIALQSSTPGQTTAERETQERAQASSNGHTAGVMKYLYRLRDTGQFRVKERGEFAAAVGEIATTLAQQIRDAYASTKVLTPDSVADIVGLEHGFESEDERADRLLAELDANGYQLNYFGAHSKGKDRIVIAEPITVALMLSACATYITRAENDALLQEERTEAVLEYTLINALLEEMPDDIVDSGQRIFKQKTFPTLMPLSEEIANDGRA